jgi:hypothetical protein
MLVREIWKCIHPRVSYSQIWYSWVNKFSYFLYPHAINVLLYRMKPRKHIYVKYCLQTYFKSIGTLSRIFKNHINGRLQMMRSECLRRFPVKERYIWLENPPGFRGAGILFVAGVITCSDFYPLSNQINLFMVINLWGIIIHFTTADFL